MTPDIGPIPAVAHGSQPPARRLRSIGALFSSAWSIVRHRGLVIVATAFLVWSVFATAAAVLLNFFVDLDRLNSIYSTVTSISTEDVAQFDAVQEELSALAAGVWLKQGWAGLAILSVILVILYLVSTATASIAVTDQSYAWLEDGRKQGVFSAIMRGLTRAVPGSAILAAYYLAIITILGLGIGLGGFGGYFLVSLFTGGNSGIAEVVGVVAGGILGLFGSIAGAIWLYTIWAVSPYAVALSAQPWSALGQSSKLTRGNRLDVFIRILIVTICVAIALSVVTIPFDFVIGFIPIAAGGLAPLLIALYARAVISALSPLVTTASLMTMYVDLGGDAPKFQGGTPVQRTP